MREGKKNFLLLFMAVAAVFASCSDDAEEPDETGDNDETIPSVNLKSLSLKIQNHEFIHFETEKRDYTVSFDIVQAGSELTLEAKPKWKDARLTITVDGTPLPAGNPLYVPDAAAPSTINIQLETDDDSGSYQITLITAAASALNESFAWLGTAAQNGGDYTIVLGQDEVCTPRILSAATLHGSQDITITLVGDGAERVIRLDGIGSLFTVNTGIKLILGSYLTLEGAAQNPNALIAVSGGTLEIKDGAKVTGNESVSIAGGIDVMLAGTLILSGGEISGNTGAFGGGIALFSGAHLKMTGGSITGNTALNEGGGIYLRETSVIAGEVNKISGGSITGNTARRGGGIYLYYADLIIEEIAAPVPPAPTPPPPIISGNTANGTDPQSGGGGIYIEEGGVTFSGGTIENNDAAASVLYQGSYNLYGLGKFNNQSGQTLGAAEGFM